MDIEEKEASRIIVYWVTSGAIAGAGAALFAIIFTDTIGDGYKLGSLVITASLFLLTAIGLVVCRRKRIIKLADWYVNTDGEEDTQSPVEVVGEK